MRTIENNYYGDDHRWFIGTVSSVADPLQLGRVQVRIYGVHSPRMEDIPSTKLPWANVLTPSTEGGVSGIGKMPQIQRGAKVVGFFLDGKQSQQPFVLGSFHSIEDPSPQQLAVLTGRTDISLSEKTTESSLFGSTPAEKAFNFFNATGFTPEQTCGIIGNLVAESGPSLNPTTESQGEYGVARWGTTETAGNRFSNLKFFSGQRALDYTALNTQLQFIAYELRTYPVYGLGLLYGTTTINEATDVFQNKYLMKADNRNAQRLGFASEIYERFAI